MTGIGVHAPARDRFDQALDELWSAPENEPDLTGVFDEVVIGGGLHAAVYCAVRVADGHRRPLVIEASNHPGGSFACSNTPSFFLNSRNRPGKNGYPKRRAGGLNVLPGALIQPCDLSGSEYQRNNDLAWIIRVTLALNARMLTSRRVTAITPTDRGYLLGLDDGTEVRATRVIDATGLGAAKQLGATLSKEIVTFTELMASMDTPFPLRNMKTVAVIGAGDSGRTAIEALVGQGPAAHWSIPSLDWVDRIDWYGCDTPTRDKFLECNRSRYRGIARFMPTAGGRFGRITPFAREATVAQGFECAIVNDQSYDCAVLCAGFERKPLLSASESPITYGSSTTVASRVASEVYRIGPACSLPFSPSEAKTLKAVPENSVAVFRYAWRTAALAHQLPEPPKLATGGVFKGTPLRVSVSGAPFTPISELERSPIPGPAIVSRIRDGDRMVDRYSDGSTIVTRMAPS